MRRKEESMALAAIGLVVGCLLLYANSSWASWEHPPQPQPAQDIADALSPLPRKVAEDYGTSDRTLVMFNIAALRDVVMKQSELIKVQEKRIGWLEVSLETMCRGLDKAGVRPVPPPIVDPNEVAK